MTDEPGSASSEANHSSSKIHRLLGKARKEFLDLTARSRLLAAPWGKSRILRVDVVDKRSDNVYKLLVSKGKKLSFLPRDAAAPPLEELNDTEGVTDWSIYSSRARKGKDAEGDGGSVARRDDLFLQTTLTSDGLGTTLLKLHYGALSYMREQGFNTLYLAIGFLRWSEKGRAKKKNDSKKGKTEAEEETAETKRERHAPLILIPVEMDRVSARAKFTISYNEDDLLTNLSLQHKLLNDFDIKLPDLSSDNDFIPNDFIPSDYFDKVRESIESQDGWEVLDNRMMLTSFSFAKFVMYRDLDPNNWPGGSALEANPLLARLLGDGFQDEFSFDVKTHADDVTDPETMFHVRDADSSQVLAIEEVRKGINCVIHGPPGTGKSQTIVNLIATMVRDGKKVLFVAEKLEALEVVKRRLEEVGLGDMCFELHSHKARKKVVLGELDRTLNRDLPSVSEEDVVTKLRDRRDKLNQHARLLNTPFAPSGITPCQAIGELARLMGAGRTGPDFNLESAHEWTSEEAGEYSGLIGNQAELLKEMGQPDQHPWRGVGLRTLLPTEAPRFEKDVAAARKKVDDWTNDVTSLSQNLGKLSESLRTFSEAVGIISVADLLGAAPEFDQSAIGHDAWRGVKGDLDHVLKLGAEISDVQEKIRTAIREVDSSIEIATEIAREFDLPTSPQTLADFDEIIDVVECLRAAPEKLDRSAIGNEAWHHAWQEIDWVFQLADRVRRARQRTGEVLSEGAWETDLSSIQRTLVAQSTGALRFLSSEYRSAVRRLKAYAKAELPRELKEQIDLLETLEHGKRAMEGIKSFDEQGLALFGCYWKSVDSDWNHLRDIASWVEDCEKSEVDADIRLIMSKVSDLGQVTEAGIRVAQERESALEALTGLFKVLGLSVQATFGVESIERLDLGVLISRLRGWEKSPNTLKDRGDLGSGDRGTLEDGIEGVMRAIAEFDEQGSALFGCYWKSVDSDWNHLRDIASWVEDCEKSEVDADIRMIMSKVSDLGQVTEAGIRVAKGRESVLETLTELFKKLDFNIEEAFGVTSLGDLEVEQVLNRLQDWEDSPTALINWVEFWRRDRRLREVGLEKFADRLHDGRMTPEQAVDTLEFIFNEAVIRKVQEVHPVLREFSGRDHDRIVEEFSDLDVKRIDLARDEVAAAHYSDIPRDGGAGEMTLIRNEIAKTRRHLPLRDLMDRAGTAVQRIKPVFMMSPMSVAQYLKPGGLTFDLLVIDEASQVKTSSALGGIARSKQMVVVGDRHQLPPNNIFDRLASEGDDLEEDEVDDLSIADIESLLRYCYAANLNEKMLLWHYRSKHESLIAVSNHFFYDDQLKIVPSSGKKEDQGLHLHFVQGGIYGRGGSKTNAIEAQAVADAVIQHAAECPNESLGVGTFSVPQRDMIRDEIELRMRKRTDLESFFSKGGPEFFFVKNLETIQGDERDVIFMSVGYARDKDGQMGMTFGPLTHEGGERRLNVLITRAKERMVVFSSITAEDIDTNRAKSEGVKLLKIFLGYAKTRHLDVPEPSDRPSDSPLEDEVAQKLVDEGYKVQQQIGTAGFFVDMAIVDPDRPGRYILGIEFDGATYHSSRSARDRDRIREDVLRDRGWTIHRIWSTDWFENPREELRKVHEAVEQAELAYTSSTGGYRTSDDAQEKLEETESG